MGRGFSSKQPFSYILMKNIWKRVSKVHRASSSEALRSEFEWIEFSIKVWRALWHNGPSLRRFNALFSAPPELRGRESRSSDLRTLHLMCDTHIYIYIHIYILIYIYILASNSFALFLTYIYIYMCGCVWERARRNWKPRPDSQSWHATNTLRAVAERGRPRDPSYNSCIAVLMAGISKGPSWLSWSRPWSGTLWHSVHLRNNRELARAVALNKIKLKCFHLPATLFPSASSNPIPYISRQLFGRDTKVQWTSGRTYHVFFCFFIFLFISSFLCFSFFLRETLLDDKNAGVSRTSMREGPRRKAVCARSTEFPNALLLR